jgi:cysteine synthase
MAEEIWTETNGETDAFVQSVGTAASLRGNAEALRSHRQDITIVADTQFHCALSYRSIQVLIFKLQAARILR